MAKRTRKTNATTEQTPVAPATTATPETTPTPATPALTVGKNGRLKARGLTCLCGCGDDTKVPDARFLPGHDAKLRAAVRKAHLSWDAVPEIARPFFMDDAKHNEATAGLLMVPGDHGHPLLRDVKRDRQNVPVADDAKEQALKAEIERLRGLVEATRMDQAEVAA